jgi:hypothetical protein
VYFATTLDEATTRSVTPSWRARARRAVRGKARDVALRKMAARERRREGGRTGRIDRAIVAARAEHAERCAVGVDGAALVRVHEARDRRLIALRHRAANGVAPTAVLRQRRPLARGFWSALADSCRARRVCAAAARCASAARGIGHPAAGLPRRTRSIQHQAARLARGLTCAAFHEASLGRSAACCRATARRRAATRCSAAATRAPATGVATACGVGHPAAHVSGHRAHPFELTGAAHAATLAGASLGRAVAGNLDVAETTAAQHPCEPPCLHRSHPVGLLPG